MDRASGSGDSHPPIAAYTQMNRSIIRNKRCESEWMGTKLCDVVPMEGRRVVSRPKQEVYQVPKEQEEYHVAS
jgi:hypothetical protein